MVKRPTTNDLPVCSVESVRRGGSGLEWLQLFRDYPMLHPSAYLAEFKTSANEAGISTLDVAVVLNTTWSHPGRAIQGASLSWTQGILFTASSKCSSDAQQHSTS